MKCPVCGDAVLVHDTRDVKYVYKGHATVIPKVTGDFCPACGEHLTGPDESRRTMDFMLKFNKEVNAAAVDPAFIVGVRKQLGLDQREAAEIFGGGVTAFSRYENGKMRPPVALIKLLKLLARHPELLPEVRAA